MTSSKITKNHNKIRRWVEERGGKPVRVKGTGDDQTGLLRIHFPAFRKDSSFEIISWEEFFDQFDQKNLSFLYQEKTSNGNKSRFFKFIRDK